MFSVFGDYVFGLKQLCLRNKLVKNKLMREDVRLKSGIYKLKSNDCDAIYIGETKRNFGIKTQEHLRAWKLNQPEKSKFAKHLIENKHSFHIEDLYISH